MPFTDVVAGNTTNATDLNQVIDALNGTTSAQVVITNSTQPLAGQLPTAPGSERAVTVAQVAGDSVARAALVVRGDGYGGVTAGAGSTPTAHLYASASGWQITENLGVGGAVTITGGLTVAGITASGSVSIAGGLTVGGTTTLQGNLTVTGAINGGTVNASVNGAITAYVDTTNKISGVNPYQPGGVATAILLRGWSGSAATNLLSVGSAGRNVAAAYIGDDGSVNAGTYHAGKWKADNSGYQVQAYDFGFGSIAIRPSPAYPGYTGGAGSIEISGLDSGGAFHRGVLVQSDGSLSLANQYAAMNSVGKLWVNSQFAYGSGFPAISLAIGDNATGVNWVGQGHVQLVMAGTTIADIGQTNIAVSAGVTVQFQSQIYPVTTVGGAGVGYVPAINFGSNTWIGTFSGAALDLTLNSQGWLRLLSTYPGGFVLLQGDNLGFKRLDGTKLFEVRNNGDITTPGAFRTSGPTYVSGTGGVYDTFDYAECYIVADIYPTGTVVCPDDQAIMSRCGHDGCDRALVVSQGGGYQIGNPAETDEHIQPLALVGRVRVRTSHAIPVHAWVCSDGTGGVRVCDRTDPGRLGYALHPTSDGQVGILIRA